MREKRELIEVVQSMISISRQCELLGIRRSSYYYCPQKDSSYNLMLMKLIDELYPETILRGTAHDSLVEKRRAFSESEESEASDEAYEA